MELTPKAFRDVQFREKLRGGYHPEDVDEFLEQAAVAAEELHDRLQRAEARAERAEQALESSSANDETLKRVLIMAQRTADQAVREAREEAERTLAEARVQGQTIVAEAEDRGRRAYDSRVADARANLDRAEDALRRAERDADALSQWVDVNRVQLLDALREAASFVEKIGFVEEPPPALAHRIPIASQEQSASAGGVGGGGVGSGAGAGAAGGFSGQRTMGGAAIGGAQGGPAGNSGGELEIRAGDSGVPGQPGDDPTEGDVDADKNGEAGGSWDPHFLDNIEGRSAGFTDAVPAGPGGAAGAAGAGGPAGPGGEDTQPGGYVPNSGGKGWGPRTGDEPAVTVTGAQPNRRAEAEEVTVAFDERALDSFFNDQDLGAERGSRFRRRG